MLKRKPQYFGHLMWRTNSLEKTFLLGKTEGRRRRGVTEDEMVGWHHRLSGHEFEQTPGDRWWRTGKPGMLQSMGWQRLGHNWATEHQQGTAELLWAAATQRPAPVAGWLGPGLEWRIDYGRRSPFQKEWLLCGLGITIIRKTAWCSGSEDVELHHSQRRGFQVGVLAETCLSWGDWGPEQGGDLGTAPPVTVCVTELGSEPSLLTPSPSLFAWIILYAPGDAFLSESSHYSIFSAWQAAKSLELLHVTILPSAEWDIQVFTWGGGWWVTGFRQ